MFQGSFKDVARKIEGCSKIPLMGIHGSFKEVQIVFQGSVPGVSRVFDPFRYGVSDQCLGMGGGPKGPLRVIAPSG